MFRERRRCFFWVKLLHLPPPSPSPPIPGPAPPPPLRFGRLDDKKVTSHVLDEHTEEVWCCRFSNRGGMLATSSADAVLLLWDVDGGGERGQGRSPTVHKRIEVLLTGYCHGTLLYVQVSVCACFFFIFFFIFFHFSFLLFILCVVVVDSSVTSYYC